MIRVRCTEDGVDQPDKVVTVGEDSDVMVGRSLMNWDDIGVSKYHLSLRKAVGSRVVVAQAMTASGMLFSAHDSGDKDMKMCKDGTVAVLCEEGDSIVVESSTTKRRYRLSICPAVKKEKRSSEADAAAAVAAASSILKSLNLIPDIVPPSVEPPSSSVPPPPAAAAVSSPSSASATAASDSNFLKILEKTEGRKKMNNQQFKEAVRAMKGGDDKAKTRVAYFKLSGRGGTEVDADEAVVLLEERVKDGDCEAKWMLGLCCEFGKGTEQDVKRALKLYRESCEGGNVVGEFLMKNIRGGRGTGVMKVNSL